MPKISRTRSATRRHAVERRRNPTTWSSSAEFLQRAGFVVGENAEAVRRPAASTTPTGYHYKCDNTGALDVNFGGPATWTRAKSAVDPIIADLRGSASARSGAPPATSTTCTSTSPTRARSAPAAAADGGFVGALEDALLEVKLIDWDAPYRRRSAASAASAAASTAARPTRRRRARSAGARDLRTPRRRCASPPSRPRSSSPACTASTTATATRSGSSSSAPRGLGQSATRSWTRLGPAAVHPQGDPP